MKKISSFRGYIHADDNCMYEIAIRNCYAWPKAHKFKSLIEKFKFVNEEQELNFNIIHVYSDGYYIYSWENAYGKKREHGYSYADKALDVLAIISNICHKYAYNRPVIQNEFFERLENMIEIKNYYLAMELLKVDYDNFE